MVVDGEVVFSGDQETVWNLLQDPQALRQAIPGCKTLDSTGEDVYQAVLQLGIAAVKGTYTAQVSLTEKHPPESYRLKIDGQGGPGFVTVDGVLTLAAGAECRVQYRFDVQVGGIVAAVGQRVFGGVAKIILGEFFKSLREQLSASMGVATDGV